MKVLIIIPAYNEQENIINTVMSVQKESGHYDCLVVNDCSNDATEKLLMENQINHISMVVNLGIGGAVQAGYQYAKIFGYDIAVQIDGDGQHDPKYIESLINELQAGADFVIGSRFIEKSGFQSSSLRRFGIKFLSLLIRIVSHQTISDVTSGCRAVNRNGIELFSDDYAQDYPEPEAIITGLRNGLVIKETPVIMKERAGGQSSIFGFKSFYYMIKVSLAIIVSGVSSRRRKTNG